MQDWAFSESRTSLEILEILEGRPDPEPGREGLEEGRGDCAVGERFVGADPTGAVGASPSSQPLEEHPAATGLSNSRQASRRRRLREERPSTTSRKENLTKGRLRKSLARPVQTEVETTALKGEINFTEGPKKVYTLEELLQRKFKVVRWNGV